MVSGEKRDTFVGKLSLLGDEWSPLRALSACGQILQKIQAGVRPPPIQAMPVFWERMERQPLPKLGKDWKCLSDNIFVFLLARAFNGRVAYWAVLILCYHKLTACQRTIKECLSECSKFTLLVDCRCTIWIRISSCPSCSIWYRVYTICIFTWCFSS